MAPKDNRIFLLPVLFLWALMRAEDFGMEPIAPKKNRRLHNS